MPGPLDPHAPATIVIAPDSFKGSATAIEVAEAIAEGWSSVRPDDTLVVVPQADGGEGTLDAMRVAVPGAVVRSAGLVTGPDGRPTPGEWLELPDGTAVVELAQCSGLPLMRGLDPFGATTFGLGEVIVRALEHGATRLVIGLGGSASTDGGLGALMALGLRALDETGEPVALGARGLPRIDTIDRSTLLAPPPGGVTLLTDVTAPLLGPTGAAAVFGPQKGASGSDAADLDAALGTLASVLAGEPSAPGAGAAGGTAYGFAAAWGANIQPGARAIAELTGLERAAGTADVVLTGEGRFDSQSLGGKLVGHVLALAAAGSARVGIIAGAVDRGALPRDPEVWAASLTELAGSAAAAIADPLPLVRRAATDLARRA